MQPFKETGDSRYIYRNELDKSCFQHDMAYGDFKDIKRRTAADKVLRDKIFNIAKDPRYDGYQRGLASMVYKKSKGSGIKPIPQNEQLAEELHKPIIKRFKKRKAHTSFIDYIWGADLVDVQLLSKYNKGIRYLLCCYQYF